MSGVIIIIGLEKLAKTFGLSVNQIAQELGIGRQTVYDWFKGKRKIPKERIKQLSKIPQFTHVNKGLFQKEIDEADGLEIQTAYFQHLSAKHSEELVDDEGITFTLDPYYQDRIAIEVLKERAAEMKRTKELLQDDSYMEELNSFTNEHYLLGLAALNDTFQENDATKIKLATDFLRMLNFNHMTNELHIDMKELLHKHDTLAREDGWMKFIVDNEK
ncbi:MAG: helix-turn-helix domain-containing protein [Anaerobacillus sp.]|uniref:helix-turn-helix domain-containing protein n=1 Tax=Anaerobacillus sp. TaxID=1872506 RepID=UPI00391D6D3A